MLKRLVLLAAPRAAAAGAFLAWPRINDVSTGKTPEYPDLQDKAYAVGDDSVAEGGEGRHRAAARLDPEGRGQGAGRLRRSKPMRTTPRVRGRGHASASVAEGGRTVVKVRSRSRVGSDRLRPECPQHPRAPGRPRPRASLTGRSRLRAQGPV